MICGPTAAGKTVAAMRLSRLANIAVISADSRQVYRRFDIGTAKPTAEERQAVPHYGIDALDPTERASAAWWAAAADGWMRDAMARGLVPVVVGGTGLYLRALFGELFEEPPMDAGRRRALQLELESLSVAELRRWVERLDPSRSGLGRTQLLRAIELPLLTGRRISELHRVERTAPRWRARYLVVDPGAGLAGFIEQRTRAMFANGWASEVRELQRTVPPDAPAWNATGYLTVRAMDHGNGPDEPQLTRDAAEERVIIDTRQYAKRQRTWFRHQLAGEDVTRIEHARDEQALADWWRGADA
ncbi:MAG: tRNA (adenosine(37)-N6)-dimethylallyltransferase MiaA [Gemmatimonadota bacterium]|nr:tRNA (adenosine(37)-N6)-dimethylallyltransferase MiaA [Gemmatimonadota bacterium]